MSYLKRTRAMEIAETRTSQSSRKRQRKAPTDLSHLSTVPDCLGDNITILICGINPGARSAAMQQHFAHPSNRFWKCLHLSGLTSERLHPSEDDTLPDRYGIGITNLASRVSASAAELTTQELENGVPILIEKVRRYRPRVLAFVGMGIYRTFLQVLMRKYGQYFASFQAAPENGTSSARSKSTQISCGVQNILLCFPLGSNSSQESNDEENWKSVDRLQVICYVVPSTSGLVTHYTLDDCVGYFRTLGSLSHDLKNGKDVKTIIPSESVVIDM